eukprot:3142742-Rhodomonas_salina.1
MIFSVKGSDRRYIPKLNLPVVPGNAYVGEEGIIYYDQLGTLPLNMLWKPVLTVEYRSMFSDFCTGKLPLLVQATLMVWIFDGDMHEFMGSDHEQASEDCVFEKYYCNINSALDEFVRSGCLSNWR